jgi:hypothetical protein
MRAFVVNQPPAHIVRISDDAITPPFGRPHPDKLLLQKRI